MSDDPADWLRHLRDGIRVDPDLPPGMIVVESGPEQVAWRQGHGMLPDGFTIGDLEEELRSHAESAPYFVRIDGRGPAVRCECCGTLVACFPEALTVSSGGDPPGSRHWSPGVWEPETGRRHTMRRCDWKQANQ